MWETVFLQVALKYRCVFIPQTICIYIHAFNRCFYPKWLTLHSLCICSIHAFTGNSMTLTLLLLLEESFQLQKSSRSVFLCSEPSVKEQAVFKKADPALNPTTWAPVRRRRRFCCPNERRRGSLRSCGPFSGPSGPTSSSAPLSNCCRISLPSWTLSCSGEAALASFPAREEHCSHN